MPSAFTWKTVLNTVTPANIAMLKEHRADLREDIGRPGMLIPVLTEAARMFGVTFTPEEQKYLEALPSTIAEGVRAVIADAVERDVDVFLTYVPGSTFRLSVTEWSEGQAVTIEIVGPDVEWFPIVEMGPGA